MKLNPLPRLSALPFVLWLALVPVSALAQQQSEASRRAEVERQIRAQVAGTNMSDAQIDAMVDEIMELSRKAVEENADNKPKPEESAKDAKNVGKVKVQGEAFRDATKSYIDKQKLSNPADQSVLDVLRREPGLIVRDKSVSIMGMPGDYTQILVDGKRPPPTFSLKNLRPEEVDYIEVMFGAEADKAAEGLAGTINFVLKRRVVKRNPVAQISVGAGLDSSIGLFSSMNAVGANGNSFTANGSLSRSWQNNSSRTVMNSILDAFGTEYSDERSTTDGDVIQKNIWLRINRVLPDTSILSASLTANDMTLRFLNSSQYDQYTGERPRVNEMDHSSRTWSMTPTVKWSKAITSNLDLEVYAAQSRSDRTWRNLTDFLDASTVSRTEGAESQTRNSFDSSVVLRPVKGTELSAGIAFDKTEWEYETLLTGGSIGQPVAQVLNTVATRTDKAAYVKLVHSFTERLGVNAGVRLTEWDVQPAHARQTSRTNGFRDRGISPSLNLVHRTKSLGRLSLNLARTNSPPGFSQLGTNTPPGFIELNRPLLAWSVGNPSLVQETSDSAVLSWERKLTPTIDTAWRISGRRISNPIAELISKVDGLWISQPINLPDAHVRAISGSAKYVKPLKQQGQTFSVTGTMVRSWTEIDGVDRSLGLRGEIPFSAIMVAEWNLGEVTAGFDLSYDRGGRAYRGVGIYEQSPDTVRGSARLSWIASKGMTVSADISGILKGESENRIFFNQGQESMSMVNITELPLMLSLTARYQF